MSVVAARGFTAAGVAAGIKAEARDVAVVLAEAPAVTAAVFTGNQAAAAPVIVSRQHLTQGPLKRGVVINSGCANAVTGATGMANARTMTELVAAGAGGVGTDYLVCSTGTIGPQLPMAEIRLGIEKAVAAADGSARSGQEAAAAITTTDSVIKEAVAAREGWVVGGMAKGAGMVRPDLATMLAVVTTDAVVDGDTLAATLVTAVDGSFNSLNIDGCESTNDTVIVMASGASGVEPAAADFTAAMAEVCRSLAVQMARDAEGASRVVTIDVSGAASDAEARYLGRLVTDSALVRSSFYGGDVNWGRIVGALGTAEVDIDLATIVVSYGGVTVFRDGEGTDFDEAAILERYAEGDMDLGISLGSGPGVAHIVTTDLTPEYVVFNGERS